MNQLTLILSLSSCLVATASNPTLRGARDSTERKLQDKKSVSECTVVAFAAAVGGNGNLASRLGVSNDDSLLQDKLDIGCEAALVGTRDLSDAVGKGPQFLKNFLDGGTTWNDNSQTPDGTYSLDEDAAVILTAYNKEAKTTVFSAPDGGANEKYSQYFSNFFQKGQECRIGVIECCYTATRLPSGSIEDNAEMCALDLDAAAKSNHIASHAFTFYDTHDLDKSYCSGFAYDEGTFDEAVKYNTLFHMAMMTNLYEKGYVKNIPGAPMCGCLNQMPIVDNASCVKPIESWTIDIDGNIGVDLSWEDCGSDLATYYGQLEGRGSWEKNYVKDHIVGTGNCAAAAKSFMNEQFLIETEWVNTALLKPTSQSTTDFGGDSARAVDGNSSGNWHHRTVTHTAKEANPWWKVDLEEVINISMIRVYNRSDCCSERLNGFMVVVYNGDEAVFTYNHEGSASYKTEIEFATPLAGDMVKVSLPGKTEYLSLAEVQVLIPFEGSRLE